MDTQTTPASHTADSFWNLESRRLLVSLVRLRQAVGDRPLVISEIKEACSAEAIRPRLARLSTVMGGVAEAPRRAVLEETEAYFRTNWLTMASQTRDSIAGYLANSLAGFTPDPELMAVFGSNSRIELGAR